MNIFANIIKRVAIAVTDQVNSWYDPFEEFTRPLVEKYPETLKDKASKFDSDMKNRFGLFNGKIWNYKITLHDRVDLGDQAIWHGIYTSMWAFKYSVTSASNDLAVLRNCIDGLHMHQSVGLTSKQGEWPGRMLIRGLDEDGNTQDDASNDSLSGHLAGIYFAWLYGNDDIKKECNILIRGIADEILANNFSIINRNGKPTQYGKLIDGIFTDPLRLTLCLAILKTAYKITSVVNYQDQYKLLLNRYMAFVAYPKVRLLWIDTRYDSHRSAIHLSILADLETDQEPKALYLKGLERVWNMEKKSGNAWITYLYSRHFKLSNNDNQLCKKVLKEFTLEDKNNVVEKINSNRKDIKTVKWGNEVMATQPLPRWQVGSQDFFWQRNLYAVDNWIGVQNPGIVHNGGDFLVAYWLGRKLDYISENE